MAETVIGCTGACCAVFYLPLTPAEFTPPRASHFRDGQQIRAMVLPLTLDAAAQRSADFGNGESFADATEGKQYTCRLFDTRTRKCLDYANRPAMCRDYPYRKACHFCGVKGGK